jgi:hypothetical protein
MWLQVHGAHPCLCQPWGLHDVPRIVCRGFFTVSVPHICMVFFGFIGHVVTALRHMPACAGWTLLSKCSGPFSLATVCVVWRCCACTATGVGLSFAAHVIIPVSSGVRWGLAAGWSPPSLSTYCVPVWRPCHGCLGSGEPVGSPAVVFTGMGSVWTT